MRDEKKSIDGVFRPSEKATGRRVGLTNEQLIKKAQTDVALVNMAQAGRRKGRGNNLPSNLLEQESVRQHNGMGSLVEQEDLEEQAEREKRQKPIKLSKKGQRKLFKAIQKGKIDPNNSAEIRTFAVKYRRKTRVKRVFGLLVLACLVVAGFFGVKYWNQVNGSLDDIFAGGNIFDVVKKDPLKKDLNGRTNVIVFGTDGYSPEDQSHPGAGLTDSIMVLSFGEETGDVYMVSLPRDMEVKHECDGYLGTWYGKLNETYECIFAPTGDEGAAMDAMRSTASEILGLDIQYAVHINFRVLIDAVDAVGGIDVLIEGDDPRGILDRNFDWECNYTCYYVKYENGEIAHLDGKHALALARARGASGGYGLSRSNFDREVNQQKILIALVEKAKTTDFVGNPQKALDLLSALGENIHTSFKVSEIRTLLDLGQAVAGDGDIASKARQIPLLNAERPEHSVVDGTGQPLAGMFNYSDIQRLINQAVTGQLDWWDDTSASSEEAGEDGVPEGETYVETEEW